MVRTPTEGFSARVVRAERSHHHAAEDNPGGAVPPGVDGGGGRFAGRLFGVLPTGGAGHAANGPGERGYGLYRAEQLSAAGRRSRQLPPQGQTGGGGTR